MISNLTMRDQIRLLHGPLRRNDMSAVELRDDVQKLSINVIRNEALEPSLALVNRLLSNFNIKAEWNIGPYDDTLSIHDFLIRPSHANLVWIDWRRVNPRLEDALFEQLTLLESISTSFVLAPLGDESISFENLISKIESQSKFTIFPGKQILTPAKWRDQSLEARNGSDLSNEGSLALARILGLQLFPELAFPTLKCLVLDFDNTLYNGVIGEDGIKRVDITPEHVQLYDEIWRLKKQGVFLSIATKNDEKDVLEFIDSREDFPFKVGDFAHICANWDAKSTSIEKISNFLNIGTDSIAILDDNPSELEQISAAHADVYCIYAKTPEIAVSMLRHGPRTSKRMVDTTGGLRAIDAKMNAQRVTASVSIVDPVILHKQLGTAMRIRYGSECDVNRAVDLFNRTNQFNMSLLRTTSIDLANNSNKHLASVEIKDNYSNSGTISMLLAHLEGSCLVIDEFVVSCRALGRKLENVFFISMLEEILKQSNCGARTLRIKWQVGPRNSPAINWLSEIAQNGFDPDDSGVFDLDIDLILQAPQNRELAQQLIERGDF
jgi:FkbH-like protein